MQKNQTHIKMSLKRNLQKNIFLHFWKVFSILKILRKITLKTDDSVANF